MTQPKSDSATSATKRTLSEESLRAMCPSGFAGEAREMVSSLLEATVLVEGGAGGREEHGVAGPGELGGAADRPVHRAGVFDLDEGGEGLFDHGGRFADREDPPGGV